MTPIRVLIGGVQPELAGERKHLRDYLRGDPLMRRFFEIFPFEDAPASDQRHDEVHLDEVERCDIYVGLFGTGYGFEDADGISPTEREFDRAAELDKHRLILLKGAEGAERHPKMRALIGRAHAGLARRRFATAAELVAGLYASLVRYLEAKELLRFGPFDAAQCSGATVDDLDEQGMYRFVRAARRARQLPLPEATSPADLLRHLNLLNRGRLNNAAVLLFGNAPQRFLISAEVKCAHSHGTEIARPIPSRHVYKGTVFELVDQAVDFVMGRIAPAAGTRAETVPAPAACEIPKEVVTEAVVNAVAHRDYIDDRSVQVMLFADRLEVVNSGRLPPPLTVEKLRAAHPSLPANPLISAPMHLRGYGDGMGLGIAGMIRRCAEAGLPEPEFENGAGYFTTRIWKPTAGVRGSTTTPARRLSSDRSTGRPESRSAPHPPATTQTPTTTQIPTRERILELLRAEAKLTRNELALRTGITPDGVKYHLARLKKAGLLRRVGSDRAGHWEVLDANPHDHDA